MASTVPISPRSMPRRVTSRISSARGIFKPTRFRGARAGPGLDLDAAVDRLDVEGAAQMALAGPRRPDQMVGFSAVDELQGVR